MPGYPAFIRRRLGWLSPRTFAYGCTRRIHPFQPRYLVAHPDDVRCILFSEARSFSSGSDDPARLRLQACLARGSGLTAAADQAEEWLNGKQPGTTFNATTEMPLLTLKIFLSSWFGSCPDHQVKQWVHALDLRQAAVEKHYAQQFPCPRRWLDWQLSECERAEAVIRDFLRENVEEGRSQTGPDLLSGLLANFPENTEAEEQLRILSAAGHEPAGLTLAFCVHLLGHHPEWQERARCSADVREQVLAETLRLYPPYWMVVRQALNPLQLPSGTTVRPKDLLLLCSFLLHRDPETFPDPESFQPDRFAIATLPTGYVPFLGCPGERIAGEQMGRILERLLARFRWRSLSQRELPLEAGTLLRPGCPVTIHLEEL